jgi:ArsR family transcriptional regulator, arsenate/arsenite/antimonite-responsive transcriptional repressor / arsenate reductase (thioredoxin)
VPLPVARRAEVHAALADPSRLGMVEELLTSDRSPSELARQFGLTGNLVAHHLDVLERAGLVERITSSGDRRRRYVHLVHDALDAIRIPTVGLPPAVLFVCTQNSARSQLAAALWRARTGTPADSAGTRPAAAVHPGAVAAARRAGLDLTGAAPRQLDPGELEAAGQVVTVCDRAREELAPTRRWWHWSTADPVDGGGPAAFDGAVAALDTRIRLTEGASS